MATGGSAIDCAVQVQPSPIKFKYEEAPHSRGLLLPSAALPLATRALECSRR